MKNKLTPALKEKLKYVLLRDHYSFIKYFWRIRHAGELIELPFQKVVCDTLDRVYSGEIKRLIINIPPAYMKTEAAVVNFIARGLAINPASLFMYVSYSQELVNRTSSAIKQIVMDRKYNDLWNLQLSETEHGKKLWRIKHYGGQVYCAALGGQLTGFRVGDVSEYFSGALIIDDPIKPSDARYPTKRGAVNNSYHETLISRLATPDVPVILISQRLHKEDMAGFFLTGGSGEKWHHLLIPADIQENFTYPKEYTHSIPIEHNLSKGLIWESRELQEIDGEVINNMERMKQNNPFVYASQYQQVPIQFGGSIFKTDWWKYYEELPHIEYRIVTADTAMKTGRQHDYSVFQVWGKSGNNIYLLDQDRGKWEAPELNDRFISFWHKHKAEAAHGVLREAYIEDKSSGTGLIQTLQGEGIPVEAVPRSKDKFTRAADGSPYIRNGFVFLPNHTLENDAHWIHDYIAEFESFSPEGTHQHDDQIDATLDAISLLLIEEGRSYDNLTWGSGVI